MQHVKVSNQSELDAALKAGHYPICVGSAYFEVAGAGRAEARENSQVTARGNSQVTARGNSQVTAWENSQVTARENSQILAADAARVKAGAYNAITKISPNVQVTGGVLIEPPPVITPQQWCDFYGVEVVDGVATVFKGVEGDYRSPHGADYSPGAMPVADDWNGMEQECGGGLHFSPSPSHALDFIYEPGHFMACPVALADIVVHYPAQFPEKIKARGLCAPAYEVDIHGKRIVEVSPCLP